MFPIFKQLCRLQSISGFCTCFSPLFLGTVHRLHTNGSFMQARLTFKIQKILANWYMHAAKRNWTLEDIVAITANQGDSTEKIIIELKRSNNKMKQKGDSKSTRPNKLL